MLEKPSPPATTPPTLTIVASAKTRRGSKYS